MELKTFFTPRIQPCILPFYIDIIFTIRIIHVLDILITVFIKLVCGFFLSERGRYSRVKCKLKEYMCMSWGIYSCSVM